MSQSCPTDPSSGPQHCHSSDRRDWVFIILTTLVAIGLALHFVPAVQQLPWLAQLSHSIFELMAKMWFGIVIGMLFVGILSFIPQDYILAIIGQPHTKRGLLRAVAGGLLLDLCSHGILMVGMKLYQRGASIGQVMAFLIASPWNSLSLTIILISLIGWGYTLLFIALSALIALFSGWLFDQLVEQNILPSNPQANTIDPKFRFWSSLKKDAKTIPWNLVTLKKIIKSGARDSQMIVKWLWLGVLLTSLLRLVLTPENFQNTFGPDLAGLGITLVVATVLEVCSEGTTPIAADIVNRAMAPGNGFAFLMTGVSTDYTEILSLKSTTKSWKIALFLPLVTLPQVIVIAWLLNAS